MLVSLPLIAVHEPPYGPIGLTIFIVAVLLFVRRAGNGAGTGRATSEAAGFRPDRLTKSAQVPLPTVVRSSDLHPRTDAGAGRQHNEDVEDCSFLAPSGRSNRGRGLHVLSISHAVSHGRTRA